MGVNRIKNIDEIETQSGTVVDLNNISASGGGSLDGIDTTNAQNGEPIVWDATANKWVAESDLTHPPAPPGEAVFSSGGWHTWVVPSGVSKVCVVCVGSGGGGGSGSHHSEGNAGEDTRFQIGGVRIVQANGGGKGRYSNPWPSSYMPPALGGTFEFPQGTTGLTEQTDFGGGNGGHGGDFDYNYYSSNYNGGENGGGGAGGYGGNGGNSHQHVDLDQTSPTYGQSQYTAPTNGAGGGGGAGFGGSNAGGGGGVGLYGRSNNGSAGTYTGAPGTGGSGGGNGEQANTQGGTGGAFGGGGGGGNSYYSGGGGGGGLAWMNDIDVSGQTSCDIYVGNPGLGGGSSTSSGGAGGGGACRIMWGDGRSFPYNAA